MWRRGGRNRRGRGMGRRRGLGWGWGIEPASLWMSFFVHGIKGRVFHLDVWILQQHSFIWSLLVARSIGQALREKK